MKGLHLLARTKKAVNKQAATSKKRIVKNIKSSGECDYNNQILMPEKLALANKMLAETPVPNNLFSDRQ